MASTAERAEIRAPAKRWGALARVWHPAATLGLVVAIILVWEWLASSGIVASILLAPPSEVASFLADMVTHGFFWENVWVSVKELVIGWAIGVGTALTLAFVMTRWDRLREALYPYVVVFAALPKIVLLPIAVAWVGAGSPATIVLIVVATFFPAYLSSFVGLSQVQRESLELMRMLGADSVQTYRMYLIPNALPMIFTGLKAAMTVAALGVVVGEFYGASAGLGYLINTYAISLNTEAVYAAIVAMSVLALVAYGLVELANRLLVRWPAPKE